MNDFQNMVPRNGWHASDAGPYCTAASAADRQATAALSGLSDGADHTNACVFAEIRVNRLCLLQILKIRYAHFKNQKDKHRQSTGHGDGTRPLPDHPFK
nr:hypothetical protein [Comamonas testosteroni]